jgi:hypothetical protein
MSGGGENIKNGSVQAQPADISGIVAYGFHAPIDAAPETVTTLTVCS